MDASDESVSMAVLPWMVIIALIIVVIAIVVPNLLPARENPRYPACINNLRIIDTSKQQWALENNKTNSETPKWEDILPYLAHGGGAMPKCPQGGTYSLQPVGAHPTCTYPQHVLP